MNAERLCVTLHERLLSLPLFQNPNDLTITDGLYFFYENSEYSPHGLSGRIVRVGNHPRSDGRLVDRLWEHYRGGKNGSVFRRYMGGALMRDEDPQHPCLAPEPGKGHWERQHEKPCQRCKPYEERVSHTLRTRFRFRCVFVSSRETRNKFEKTLIASLSACSVCKPSDRWLGRHAYSNVVRSAGMWNSQFVGGTPLSEEELQQFTDYVVSTPTG